MKKVRLFNESSCKVLFVLLLTTVCVLIVGVTMILKGRLVFVSGNEVALIKDPCIVYSNLRIEQLDTRGVAGVASRKQIEKALQLQSNGLPFKDK